MHVYTTYYCVVCLRDRGRAELIYILKNEEGESVLFHRGRVFPTAFACHGLFFFFFPAVFVSIGTTIN